MYSVDDVIAFMSSYTNILQQNVDLDIFLIPGYYKYNSGYIFVTEVGMKHLISGLLCFYAEWQTHTPGAISVLIWYRVYGLTELVYVYGN